MSTEVMLATRLGQSSAAPARVAAELADRLDAHITVLYVAAELSALDTAGGESGVDPRAERERLQARIDGELKDFTARYLSGRDVSVRVLEGRDVAEQVTSAAADAGAAFLVVGTRGRSQIARLILGDTTQSILQRTPCPVVVVPLEGDEAGLDAG
jgi:nucleotide-binding universal stress UspA family protein